ncbi:MAG TPA: hypothetical protein VFW04_12925 [Gemmatimonadaceae bacterium]|nr:hypothetical protein [Gemmatimonadaceae bacterium]
MRLTRWICGLTVAAASGCSSSLTAPPNGLPARVSLVAFSNDGLPSVAAAGDSVAVVAANPNNPCASHPTVVAGLRSGSLIMTLSTAIATRPCPVLAIPTAFSVTVHDVPSGTRAARLALRTVNAGKTEESTLASTTITLP